MKEKDMERIETKIEMMVVEMTEMKHRINEHIAKQSVNHNTIRTIDANELDWNDIISGILIECTELEQSHLYLDNISYDPVIVEYTDVGNVLITNTNTYTLDRISSNCFNEQLKEHRFTKLIVSYRDGEYAVVERNINPLICCSPAF